MTSRAPRGLKSRNTSRFCCFHVFDTLSTRTVGNPEHLFLLLGRRLLLAGHIPRSAEVFARQRVQAEERANRIQIAHSTLEEIYKELIASLNAQPYLTPLVEAEWPLCCRKFRLSDFGFCQPYPHDRRLVAAACKPSTGNYATGIVNRGLANAGLRKRCLREMCT
jgi:hypothetical protein